MTEVGEIQNELEAASAAVRERDLLVHRAAVLRREYEAARDRVTDRRADLLDAEDDVEALEKVSLTRIVAGLRGTRNADMDRERAEAEAARLRFAEARAQREELKSELEAVTSRLSGLGDVDRRYEDVLAAKAAWLADRGGTEGQRIAVLAEERGRLLAERREIAEAAEAATTALQALHSFDVVLGRTERWLTYDTHFGSGLGASQAKRERLDKAAGFAAGVNRALARLSRELADVEGTETEIGSVPNLVSDVSMHSQIRAAKAEIPHLVEDVTRHQTTLNDRLGGVDARLRTIDEERAGLLGASGAGA